MRITKCDIIESKEIKLPKVPKFILEVPKPTIEKDDFMGDETGEFHEEFYSTEYLGNVGDTFKIKNDNEKERIFLIISMKKMKVKDKIIELSPSIEEKMREKNNEITIYNNLLNNIEPNTSEELITFWKDEIKKNTNNNIKKWQKKEGIKKFKYYWRALNKTKKYKMKQEIYVYKYDELLEPIQCAGCKHRETIIWFFYNEELCKPCSKCIRKNVKTEDCYKKMRRVKK